MIVSRGTTRAPRALLRCLVLAACLLSPAAMAQSREPQGCAPAPTSSLEVDVKTKGAKGDGETDDTAAIQAAIEAAAGAGGTVLVPDGTFMVDAAGETPLSLKSDMVLKLSARATLKALPNAAKKYAVLAISGVSNVTVVGGTLQGDRDEHEQHEETELDAGVVGADLGPEELDRQIRADAGTLVISLRRLQRLDRLDRKSVV